MDQTFAKNNTVQRKVNNVEKEDQEGSSLMPPEFSLSADTVQAKMGEDNNGGGAGAGAGAGGSGGNAGAGDGLPGELKGKMEGAFGADFSDVKVHQNSAQASNLGAQAFAQGNDLHFAPGKYDPKSAGGQELIGHELTHVVQQRQGRVQPTMQAKGAAINNDSGLENEADQLGKMAAQGKQTGMSGGGAKASGGGVQQHRGEEAVLERVKQYDGFISEASAKYGIPIEQIRSIIAVESAGRPQASSGVAFGLMQITKGTWEGAQRRFPELSAYGFDANWTNPRINILFGTAILTQKMSAVGVGKDDPNFATVAVTAYNAGEGTVKRAMRNATNAGSQNPSEDFLKPEYLKEAIEHYRLYSYYMPGHAGGKWNTAGTKQGAIDLKYKEITGYAPKVETYLGLQGVADGPEGDTQNDNANSNGGAQEQLTPQGTGTVTATSLNVRSGPGTGFGRVGSALSKGASVTIFGESNGWIQIGQNRWVFGKYINRGNTTSEGSGQEQASGSRTGTVTAAALNVRTGPGASFRKAGAALPKGTSITIQEEKDGWYKVGQNRWVFGKYVQVNGGSGGAQPTVQKGTVTAAFLNVRSGPSSRNRTVGSALTKGTEVTVLEEKNGWIRIAAGKWVYGKYLNIQEGGVSTNTPDNQEETQTTEEGTVTASALNVRSGPGGTFKIARAPLRNGEKVTIYEEKSGWLRIGSDLWVSGKYIARAGQGGGTQPTTPTNEEPTNEQPTNENPGPQVEDPGIEPAVQHENYTGPMNMEGLTGSVGKGGANKSQADIAAIQTLLNNAGATLQVDGVADRALEGAIFMYQAGQWGRRSADGRVDVGGGTWRSLKAGTFNFSRIEDFDVREEDLNQQSGIPREDDLESVYGSPGDDSNIERYSLPFTLYYGDAPVSSIRLHKKVGNKFISGLSAVLSHYGIDEIKRLRIDRNYGGSYVVRKKRGGSSWSTHAYGIAVDFNHLENQLSWGSNKAIFAQKEYEPFMDIMEQHGFYNLGRWKNYDFMHFQAAFPI